MSDIEIYSRDWWKFALATEAQESAAIGILVSKRIAVHSAEIAAFIRGEDIQLYAEAVGVWRDCSDGSSSFGSGTKYRIKPKTRMIGDVECPMPISSFEGHNIVYSIIGMFSSGQVTRVGTMTVGTAQIARGGLFTTQEDAQINLDALLKLTRIGGGDE